jgi:DNA ligase (NAD+)
MTASVRKQIEALREQIELYNYLYYVEAAPEISDLEFDRLLKRLQELEAEHPELVTPDSPTQRVGGQPLEGFRSVRHRVPMLSIDNTYNEADLREFDARVRRGLQGEQPQYVAEHKVDGVSVSVRYEHGRLILGATRGDGVRGDDITQNVRTVRDIPLRLRHEGRAPEVLEVRGEVYMANSELARLNKLQSERGQRLFANSRNATAGSLKLLDPRICAQRGLRFFAHSEGERDGLRVRNHLAFLDLIHACGIPVVPHSQAAVSIDEVLAYCEEHFAARHALDYETDGMVIKVTDFARRERLGSTAKAPRWAIAYKVELWQASTHLRRIRVQVGKTGVLTPVGELETVVIAGTKVSRVSLHNADEIARKNIRVGDMVVVEKGGKVIPHVVRVELEQRRGREKRYRFPTRCPSCGSPVARDEGGVYIRCLNPSCPAQLKERLHFFAHRQAMNIEGLGPALINQLVERGLVRSLPDLYRLNQGDLVGLEHIGDKTAQKLLDHLEASKDRGLAHLLTGLGIRHVGARNAKLLATTFGTMAMLLKASKAQIIENARLGTVAGGSVHQFLHCDTGRKTISELRDLGVRMTEKRQVAGAARLAGKNVAVTGTLSRFKRDEIKDLIEELGGKAAASVSHQTDYIVAGEKAGSKLERARQLGIKVLDEAAFLRLIGRK